jgi:VanZ family protein
LNEDAVDNILNPIINILIGLVFVSLLVYLMKKGRQASILSYIWLVVFFIITTYFLMRVEITRDRLHFLGYGILSLFLYRALRHNFGTEMLYIWSGSFIMLFGVLDETLQLSGLGGRNFELKDIGIDWLSGLIGQAIIAFVVRPKLEAVDIKIRRYIKNLKQQKAYRLNKS